MLKDRLEGSRTTDWTSYFTSVARPHRWRTLAPRPPFVHGIQSQVRDEVKIVAQIVVARIAIRCRRRVSHLRDPQTHSVGTCLSHFGRRGSMRVTAWFQQLTKSGPRNTAGVVLRTWGRQSFLERVLALASGSIGSC